MIRPIGCRLTDKTGNRALLQRGHQHYGGRVRGAAGEYNQPSIPIDALALDHGIHEPHIKRAITA